VNFELRSRWSWASRLACRLLLRSTNALERVGPPLVCLGTEFVTVGRGLGSLRASVRVVARCWAWLLLSSETSFGFGEGLVLGSRESGTRAVWLWWELLGSVYGLFFFSLIFPLRCFCAISFCSSRSFFMDCLTFKVPI